MQKTLAGAYEIPSVYIAKPERVKTTLWFWKRWK
jgi:hypothetical protein